MQGHSQYTLWLTDPDKCFSALLEEKNKQRSVGMYFSYMTRRVSGVPCRAQSQLIGGSVEHRIYCECPKGVFIIYVRGGGREKSGGG